MAFKKRKITSSKRGKPSAGGWILRLISIISAGGLLISLLSPYIPPDQYWLPAFFGLAFPVFIIINAILLILWILRRRWFSLIHLILLVPATPMAFRYIQVRSDQPIHYDFATQLISYNVRSLIDNEGKSSVQGLLKMVTQEKPDILCLQEYRDDWWQKDDNTKKILEAGLFKEYVFESYYPVKSNKKAVGIALFSKYPIHRSGALRAGKRLIAIYADLVLKKDTVRLFNMHLQSIAFQKKDYELVEGLMDAGKPISSELETDSRQLLWKVRKAFIKRSFQARLLQKAIEQSPYPVIVCGDMNDTPCSYAYNKVSANLQDAFQYAGHRIGNTYLGKLPKIRIDYVFLDRRFKCLYFDILHYHLSDHYPVNCWFYLKEYQ
jgi:endonuclease/exonuclease/phosphatase family metal-dependent hydrolase